MMVRVILILLLLSPCFCVEDDELLESKCAYSTLSAEDEGSVFIRLGRRFNEPCYIWRLALDSDQVAEIYLNQAFFCRLPDIIQVFRTKRFSQENTKRILSSPIYSRINTTIWVTGDAVEIYFRPSDRCECGFDSDESNANCGLHVAYKIHQSKTTQCDEVVEVSSVGTVLKLEPKNLGPGCGVVLKAPLGQRLALEVAAETIIRFRSGTFKIGNANLSVDILDGKNGTKLLELSSDSNAENKTISSKEELFVSYKSSDEDVLVSIPLQFVASPFNTTLDCDFSDGLCEWKTNATRDCKWLILPELNGTKKGLGLVRHTMGGCLAELRNSQKESKNGTSCFVLTYQVLLPTVYALYGILEMEDQSKLLFSLYGNEIEVNKTSTMEFEVKTDGNLRILALDEGPHKKGNSSKRPNANRYGRIEEHTSLKFYSIHSSPDGCRTEELNINCQFNGTICGWANVPSASKKFRLTDSGILGKAGSKLSSPFINGGQYCIFLSVSGNGGLLVYAKQGAFLNQIGIFLATSYQQIFQKRISFQDSFNIVLEVFTFTSAKNSSIFINDILLLDQIQCDRSISVVSEHREWQNELQDKDDYELVHTFGIASENALITNPMSYVTDEWFCFSYDLTLPPNFNSICLELVESSSDLNKTIWKQCSSFGQNRYSECFEIGVSLLPIQFILKSTSTEDVITMVNVEGKAVVSAYWLTNQWKCDLDKLVCGWSQPNLTSIYWVVEKMGKLDVLVARVSDHATYDVDQYGFIVSPVIEPSSDFVCIRFNFSGIDASLKLNLIFEDESTVGVWEKYVHSDYYVNVAETIQTGFRKFRLGFGAKLLDKKLSWLSVGKIAISVEKCLPENIECEFDSNLCGLSQEPDFGENVNSTKEWIVGGLTDNSFPSTDCYLNVSKSGGYASIMSANFTGSSYALRTTPFLLSDEVPVTENSRFCVSFCYFLYTDDETRHISLNLERIITENSVSTPVWRREGSYGRMWFRVQIPIEITDFARYSFRAFGNTHLRSGYKEGVAIDSLRIKIEDLRDCPSYEEIAIPK